MVVLCQTVNLVPQGKHWGFESLPSDIQTVEFQSGQMGGSVKPLLRLRRFKSYLHNKINLGVVQ